MFCPAFASSLLVMVSGLSFLVVAQEPSLILMAFLGEMPFPSQLSVSHPRSRAAPGTNEGHRGIEPPEESPVEEPCSLG